MVQVTPCCGLACKQLSLVRPPTNLRFKLTQFKHKAVGSGKVMALGRQNVCNTMSFTWERGEQGFSFCLA